MVWRDGEVSVVRFIDGPVLRVNGWGTQAGTVDIQALEPVPLIVRTDPERLREMIRVAIRDGLRDVIAEELARHRDPVPAGQPTGTATGAAEKARPAPGAPLARAISRTLAAPTSGPDWR